VCVSPNLSTKTRNSENNETQRLLTKGGKGKGMALEARTVLVTGGAQGIGFGIAEYEHSQHCFSIRCDPLGAADI
jgi:hypothetical protein